MIFKKKNYECMPLIATNLLSAQTLISLFYPTSYSDVGLMKLHVLMFRLIKPLLDLTICKAMLLLLLIIPLVHV